MHIIDFKYSINTKNTHKHRLALKVFRIDLSRFSNV